METCAQRRMRARYVLISHPTGCRFTESLCPCTRLCAILTTCFCDIIVASPTAPPPPSYTLFLCSSLTHSPGVVCVALLLQLFTVVYALLGLVFVFAALSPLLDLLIWIKDLILNPCTPPDPLETDDDGTLEVADLRERGNWGFKYFSATMGPIIVFVIGLVIGYLVLNLDTVDGARRTMRHTRVLPLHCPCGLPSKFTRAAVRTSWLLGGLLPHLYHRMHASPRVARVHTP